MTPEETERDRAPERIWIDAERTYSATSFSAGIKYIRADLHDAEVTPIAYWISINGAPEVRDVSAWNAFFGGALSEKK